MTRIPQCPNGHTPDYWLVGVREYRPDLLVIMDRRGLVTDLAYGRSDYVPEWVRQLAAASEDVYCAECMAICAWKEEADDDNS